MDGQRFDEVARLIGTGASRRRVLKGLLGGITAGVVMARSRGETGAQDACDAFADPCTTGPDSCCPGLMCQGGTCCSLPGESCSGAQDCCVVAGNTESDLPFRYIVLSRDFFRLLA